MRRALFIALVIIVVVTGLPVLITMADMAACDFCGPGVLLPLMCLAALVAAAILLPALLRAPLRLQERLLRPALFASFSNGRPNWSDRARPFSGPRADLSTCRPPSRRGGDLLRRASFMTSSRRLDPPAGSRAR